MIVGLAGYGRSAFDSDCPHSSSPLITIDEKGRSAGAGAVSGGDEPIC